MMQLEIERVALAAQAVCISRRWAICLATLESEGSRQTHSRVWTNAAHIGESWAEYRAMRAYVYETSRVLDLDSGVRP